MFNTVSFNAQPGNLLPLCLTDTTAAYLLAAAACTDWHCPSTKGSSLHIYRVTLPKQLISAFDARAQFRFFASAGFESTPFPSGSCFPPSKEVHVRSNGNSKLLSCVCKCTCASPSLRLQPACRSHLWAYSCCPPWIFDASINDSMMEEICEHHH